MFVLISFTVRSISTVLLFHFVLFELIELVFTHLNSSNLRYNLMFMVL